MDKFKYLFSVVIPVYNVEDYLSETLESIVNQTIGINNIQVILINDGSKDNSEKICKKYSIKYPDNIEYYYQKNSGVSAARNNGLQKAKGKYVLFLDSDDKWDLNTFSVADDFFRKYENINCLSFKIKHFERINTNHYLNFKYKKECVIDLNEKPNYLQTTIGNVIFRRDAVKEHRFDERLKYGEDGKFVNDVIFENDLKYGVTNKATFYYRKRMNESSAVQTKGKSTVYYSTICPYFYSYFADKSNGKYGKVLKCYQYLILNDIKFAFRIKIHPDVDKKIVDKFYDDIQKILLIIDDDVIENIFEKNFYHKIITFKMKYKNEFNKKNIVSYIANNIEIFEYDDNNLVIEGNIPDVDSFNIYYSIGNKKYKVDTFKRLDESIIFSKKYFLDCLGYQIKIPKDELDNISFYVEKDNKKIKVKNQFSKFSRLNNYKLGYYYDNKILFNYDKKNNVIKIEKKPSFLKVFFKEIIFDLYILIVMKKLLVFLERIGYFFLKIFMKKDIWLISDREFMGRDSGEVLYKYILNNYPKEHNVYFVVSKSSKDYERLKKIGKVVPYHSLKYKLYFLKSKYIISSHFDAYVSNEFGKSRKFLCDLYRFKYIYLTHGILLHDSSKMLNKYNKKFNLVVSTSKMEYESMTKDKYYYFDDEIKLTGLARYDNLYDKNDEVQNKILFMPSWRNYLAGAVIPGGQKRLYNPDFVKSDYYKFYDKLLNDKKLLDLCRKKDYKIKFCVHPSFRSQLKDFKGNDIVEYCIDCDSQYETRTSKMLVTDYSSAACDFAFMKKPVVYANFDYEETFKNHYYDKGYFDYDENGFGPNCLNYEDTLNEIIKFLNLDCKNSKKYIERDEEFFAYFDSDNAKRIYEEIIKIDKKI